MPIMIDAGSYLGKIIETYQQSDWIDESWEIYSFEPITDLFRQSKEEFKRMGLPVISQRAACWTKDGTVRMNVHERQDASFISDDGSRRVPCIDFPAFVDQFDSVDLCSMDIEGAEWKVLRKMLDNGTARKLEFLDIEFHSWGDPNSNREDALELIKRLTSEGVVVRLKDRLR